MPALLCVGYLQCGTCQCVCAYCRFIVFLSASAADLLLLCRLGLSLYSGAQCNYIRWSHQLCRGRPLIEIHMYIVVASMHVARRF
ncbi:hypothetical protein M5D96_010691 [Drosophila gunungcola]|uniref:Uncharacterized protein n=1 Tax=Drosophila gunungcola TaxID=103775 RepID=A0A9Q0BLF3_9MUSC|nr:hypothetical protein M5D96_010691 [Drosophila gunungcola]